MLDATNDDGDDGDGRAELGPHWLVEHVLVFMGAVGKSIGPHATPYFEALLPLLPSCFDPADFFLVRQTFIAVLGFLTTALGDSMVSYLQLLLPIVQQGMVDELAETDRKSTRLNYSH